MSNSRRHGFGKFRARIIVGALLVALALVSRGDAFLGILSQLPDPDGCIVNGPSADIAGCTNTGKALEAASSVAVSPDGKHVYVASPSNNAVAVFARDKTTGALTQLAGTAGCVRETPVAGDCADGTALRGAVSVTLSPDGKHVYVASDISNAVAVFARDKTTGVLTQLAGTAGCVSETGQDGTSGPVVCAVGKALDGAASVAVSPDGKHLYVASLSTDAVAVFARDKTTGALTQLAGTAGCVSETGQDGFSGPVVCTVGKALGQPFSVAVSPDGKHVYVASPSSNAVAVFARDKTTGALTQLAGTAGCVSETGQDGISGPVVCADGKALDGAASVAVSPDGKYVYVASFDSDAIAVFARDKTTGALTQLAGLAGCVSQTGSGGACATGVALDGAQSVAMSHDGKNVYVASQRSNAVVVFARDKTTGELIELDTSLGGCVSEDGTGGACADGKALVAAASVAVSRDGKHVYVASISSGAVAVFARAK